MAAALKELQDSLNDLFGFRRRAQVAAAMTDDRRLDKAALAKARRLAATHGLDIERDGVGEYWVTCAALSDTNEDPCEGNHFCVGGREVLTCVEAYVDHLTKNA